MAEHELNKIVDDEGEVFNLRDSTKQPTADRVTAWGSTPSDTKYPSEKLVKDSLDGKQATLAFDGTYNASTNKAATVSTVTNAISGLDVSSVGGNGKYISAISETDGKISATATTMDTTPTASSTKAVTSGGIKTALDGKIPFGYKIFDTNPFGGKRLYINYMSNAMYSMDKRYFVTATIHNKTDGSVEYPRVKPGAVETDDDYFEDGPIYSTCSAADVRKLFNGNYDNVNGITIPAGKYLKVHIQFSNEENWSPSSTTSAKKSYPYGSYYLSFYDTNIPTSAQWRCYNKYQQHGIGWKSGSFGYYAGSADSTASIIMESADNVNYVRSCIEFLVFAKDSINTNLTQIDWALVRPTLSMDFPFFTNFDDQKSYVNWLFKHNDGPSSAAVIKIDIDNETITTPNLVLGNALPVTYGGTGKTTAKAAEYNLTTGKSEISDTTSGDDRVVFELASPSESNGVTRGFRKLSTIWTWIKGLLSSESGVNISGSSASCTGNAATATAAQSGSALETAINGKMNTSASNATAPSASGGDGATATLLNNLTDGKSDIVTTDDGDNVLIATTDNGGSVTNKWYKRKLVKLIPWIIKKLGTRLVYDCGAGSTSGDDFDAALAAFNAGQWVIIRKDGNAYHCVGTYNSGLRFKQIANDASLLKVNTLSWTRGSSPSVGTQIEASLSGHTHSQYLTASSITGKMDTDASNATAPSSSGGDGATATLLNNLTSGNGDISTSNGDNVLLVTTDNGGSVTNKWYKRPLSKLWPWIISHTQVKLLKASSESWIGVGTDDTHYIELDYDGTASSPTMGIWVRWASGSGNGKYMAECNTTGDCKFNGSSESVVGIDVATRNTSTYRLSLGYTTTLQYDGHARAIVTLHSDSDLGSAGSGIGVTILVSVDWKGNTANRHVSARVLNNDAFASNIMPGIIVSTESGLLHFYVVLLGRSSDGKNYELKQFNYTSSRVIKLGGYMNWEWDIGHNSVSTISSTDYVFPSEDCVTYVCQPPSNVIGSGSPATDCVAYWTNYVAKGSSRIVYNNNGQEYTLLFSKSADGKYGTILRWGYRGPSASDISKIEMLRCHNNNWLTSDWQGLSVDNATNAANADTVDGVHLALGSYAGATNTVYFG